MNKLEIYDQKPPSWRLPISSTSLEYPDYQPPIPGKDEDVVNQNTVRNGYTAQPAVQNETFSCHQLIIDSLQTNQVAQNLEFIFKSALDNRHTRNHPQSNYIKDIGSTDPDVYFQQLASPEIPLQSLLKLPRNLNPQSILHHLQHHRVDSRRSVWFVKLTSKPSSDKRQLSLEWTNVLTDHLSRKLVELPTPESSLDQFDSKTWLSQFSFILDIIRAFTVNGLLDNLTLHVWLLGHLKRIHLARLPLVATLVVENIEGFYSSHQLANGLVAAACQRIGELRVAHASEHLGALGESLERIIVLTFYRFPYCFISPKLWMEHSALLESLIGTQPLYPAIKVRNKKLLYGNKDKSRTHTHTHYCPRQSLMRDINILDTVNTDTSMRVLTLDFFEVSSGRDGVFSGTIDGPISVTSQNNEHKTHQQKRTFKDKVNTLLNWAVSDCRNSQHRCYAVATLLRFYVSLQVKQKSTTKDTIKQAVQEMIFVWLEGASSGRRDCDIPKLLGELVRRRMFSYSSYIQHIIASGLMDNPKKKDIHSNVLLNTPLFDASLSIVNLRRMTVDRDVNASCEKAMDSLTRTFRAILPRLYKKAESIPAITTLDLENSFSAYKTMPLFYQYRAIHTNLLPAVAAFTDSKTSESRLSVEELATVIGILEYFEDYASLHALIVGLLPTISDRQVLFLLMDTIRRSWTVLVCLNAMDKLNRSIIEKYNSIHSSGGQVRPLVLLLMTAKETMQLPQHLHLPVKEAVSGLEKSLKTSMSSTPPPSTISDVQKLLHDSSTSNAADLATTLWFRHSSYSQWGSSVWAGVLDALRVGSKHEFTPQLVSCFSVFLHEVNNRFPDGLEKHITESLVKHPGALLSGDLSVTLKSIVVQMVVRRVIQTTSFIEEVYLPLSAHSPSEEVLVNLNDILLAILTPEKNPPMVLSDYQHLMTRRGKAYRRPHLAKLAQVLPTLVGFEVSGAYSETAKSSCRKLREAMSAQVAFSTACMRDIDSVYDVMMACTNGDTQELIIETLKALTSFGGGEMEQNDIFNLTIHHANPWTFCRHKIVLRLLLNYGRDAQERCSATISDLLRQMQANGLVKDMLRGINGRAGIELANISFDKIQGQLVSLKGAIEGGIAADESRVAVEICEAVETVSDVLLYHKAVLPEFDRGILANTVKILTSCFHVIFVPKEELENGEVVEEEDVGTAITGTHSQALVVLCLLVQVLLRVPESSASSISSLGSAVLPYLLRHLAKAQHENDFNMTYDTVVGISESLFEVSQQAFDVLDSTDSSLSTEIRRLLPPTHSMRTHSKFNEWDLLDQIPGSERGDKRVQFNAPQLHKWLDARLANDHLLHANQHIPLEYERNVPGDGLEAGPVLAYQFRRSLRTEDQTMSTEAPVDDIGETDLAFNLKKRKADEDQSALSNGSVAQAAQPAPTTTTQARRTSNRRRK